MTTRPDGTRIQSVMMHKNGARFCLLFTIVKWLLLHSSAENTNLIDFFLLQYLLKCRGANSIDLKRVSVSSFKVSPPQVSLVSLREES